ncbi:uncharacterized protein LOC121872747 [Homarus americanus]|uniref:Transmembrane protein 254 n=1 Tax=Homarus americanus TaxID=6706 RepID=A0A8J5NBI9_HOMAM|nr:uncharacterized protein LOC121872747 [Homarus americanus]KAG7176569.1 Transmembrane protein 254-like 2 [Homarus americanus]
MSSQGRGGAHYFVLVHPCIIAFIGSGLVMMALTWKCPEVFKNEHLGLLGQFLHWLGTEHNTFMMLVFTPVMTIHVMEAVVAVYLCGTLGLTPPTTVLWVAQILVVGILSLRFLIWPLRDLQNDAKTTKRE